MRTWRVNNTWQIVMMALLVAGSVYFFLKVPLTGPGVLAPGLLLLAAAVAIPYFLVWRIETGEGGLVFCYLPPRPPQRIQWREVRGIRTLHAGRGDWYQLQLRDGRGPSIPPGPRQRELVEYIAVSAGLRKGTSARPKGQV